MEKAILRGNVVVEPLVAGWHAWSHLVSPACAALNFVHHIKLMQSFLEAPELHAMANKDPKLKGGPFIDLPESSLDEVKSIIARTLSQQAHQLQIAEDIREIYNLLMREADGFSLEQLYDKIPVSMRGYVELSYNLLGMPNLKLHEALLYKSSVYNENLQSSIVYALQEDEERKFVFSTPRLNQKNCLEIKRPFKDKIYDKLAELRYNYRVKDEIISNLGFNEDEIKTFNTFLTTKTNQITKMGPPTKSTKSGWRYFGHACVLVTSDEGHTVLVDPLIPYDTNDVTERFSFAELPEYIDVVILTHNHTDHVLLETLLTLRHKIGKVIVPSNNGSLADPSLKLMLEAIGFSAVLEMKELESYTRGDIELTALPFFGEHGDLDISSKAAWLVSAGKRNMLFAADSNNIEPKLYDILAQHYGDIDTIFIGMECVGAPMSWVYGPLLAKNLERKNDQSRRLNGSDSESAIKLIDSLGCKNVYVYAMGMEPWLEFIAPGTHSTKTDSIQILEAKKFVSLCKERSLNAELLFGRDDSMMARISNQ